MRQSSVLLGKYFLVASNKNCMPVRELEVKILLVVGSQVHMVGREKLRVHSGCCMLQQSLLRKGFGANNFIFLHPKSYLL